ncbi:MAG TPA: hypothetical protein VGA70_09515 [Longimicrobiales bacterium]|jgi:hypothetical protein
MKLIVLFVLEDDAPSLRRLLEEHSVVAFSELSVEGHGEGRPGWYGHVAPYRSRMIVTAVPAERAHDLMEVVRACAGCQDPRHPVHALQLDVEAVVRSGEAGTGQSTHQGGIES